MKTRVWVVAIALTSLFGESACFAEEEKMTGRAGLAVFSQYVSRGCELSAHSVVFQPLLGITYRGFSVSFWGNIDSDEHATQSFTPDNPGHTSFNETNYNLSYKYSIGKLELTGGYVHYGVIRSWGPKE